MLPSIPLTRTLQFVVVFMLSGMAAQACNIPVFRYALERWNPDSCEVIVFHRMALKADDEIRIQALEQASLAGNGVANLNVIRCDVATTQDKELSDLWETVKGKSGSSLPTMVIRSKHGKDRIINHWHGSLDQAEVEGLVESPARAELIRRLQSGDAIVWLLLKSPDEGRTKIVREMLRAQCEALPKKVELPEGIGLPGSELYSEVPLLLQFSVLEIDPSDPKEQFLVKLLTGFQPEAAESGEPLIAPVFGRGRALEVVPAGQLDAELMEGLTVFLCGACSCQVKEQNPGFDLLLSTNWNTVLFGEDSEGPPPVEPTGSGRAKEPVLVPIPPGKKTIK